MRSPKQGRGTSMKCRKRGFPFLFGKRGSRKDAERKQGNKRNCRAERSAADLAKALTTAVRGGGLALPAPRGCWAPGLCPPSLGVPGGGSLAWLLRGTSLFGSLAWLLGSAPLWRWLPNIYHLSPLWCLLLRWLHKFTCADTFVLPSSW